MGKQLSLGVFLTSWILGLFLVFSDSPIADAATFNVGESQLQTSKSLFVESFSLPEAPSFEADLEPFVSTPGIKNLLDYSKFAVVEIPFSEYTTFPFFDVKQTFIHFFHTW